MSCETTNQKLNKEAKELTEVMSHLGLTDISRTFHPNTKEHTYFSAPLGTFSKVDHILGDITNFNRYKKIWNSPLYLIRPPCFKVEIQQQHKLQKTYKLMETEQWAIAPYLGQRRNKKKKKKLKTS